MAACGAEINEVDSETIDVDDEKLIDKYGKIELDDNAPRMVQHFSELDVYPSDEKIDQEPVVTPGVKFNDVFATDKIKDVLKAASTPPLKSKPILLYGPSGTGKSLLASAVVNEASSVTSSYTVSAQGLQLQRLKQILDRAVRMSPSIVFIDKAHELPAEAADCLSKAEGILLLGETNRPMDMCEEILAVYPNRYHVKNPAVDGITNIVNHVLGDLAKSFTKNDFDAVIQSFGSEQFTTAELKNLIEDSINEKDVSAKTFAEKVNKLKTEKDDEKQQKYHKEMQEWTLKFDMD